MKYVNKLVIIMLVGGLTHGTWAKEDPLRPRIPLHPNATEVCPVSILTPFSLKKGCAGTPEMPELKGCKGVWLGVGCDKWVDGASYLFFRYFQYNIEHNEFYRHVDVDLYRKPLDKFVLSGAAGNLAGADQNGNVILDSAGFPVLVDLIGDCGQEKTRKIEVTTILGGNWKGWMWEQSFAEPKNKLRSPYCRKFTPKYRCISLVIGNDTVSAAFSSYCFLRKKVDNLDDELSYDVFMGIVNTIRFKEGVINQ